MKELILVRHGDAEHIAQGFIGGSSDFPLTDRGRKQISLTSKRLKDLFGTRIEHIFASDMKRASESAIIIQKELEIPVTYDSRLREISRGVANGMAVEEAKKIRRAPTQPILDWIPYPGGESWRMLRNRASDALREIEETDKEVVLLVCHGNLNCAMIELWLQLPEDYLLDFVLQPASITVLGVSVFGHREISKLNETAHLACAGLEDSLFDN